MLVITMPADQCLLPLQATEGEVIDIKHLKAVLRKKIIKTTEDTEGTEVGGWFWGSDY